MATTQSTPRQRPTVPRRLWEVTVHLTCAWGVAHVLPGIALSGSVRRQLIVVVALSFFDQLLSLPVRYAGHAEGRARLSERFGRLRGLGCLGYLGIMASTIIGGPLAWWLTARLAEALSLPFRIEGFWPLVLAPLAVAVLSWLPLQAPRVVTEPAVRAVVSGQVARVLAAIAGFGVLWAVGVLGFDEDVWWRAAITLVLLASLYHLPGVHMNYTSEGWPVAAVRTIVVRGTVISLVLGPAMNALLLWTVAWISPFLGPRMWIAGFWPLLGGALFLLALTWAVSTPPALRVMRRTFAAQGVTGPEDPFYGVVRVGRHGFIVAGPD